MISSLIFSKSRFVSLNKDNRLELTKKNNEFLGLTSTQSAKGRRSPTLVRFGGQITEGRKLLEKAVTAHGDFTSNQSKQTTPSFEKRAHKVTEVM